MLDLLGLVLLGLALLAVAAVVLWMGATVATGWLGEKLFDLLVPGRDTGLGTEGMIGRRGTVVRAGAAGGEGTVRVGGELWSARWPAEPGLDVGAGVRVVAVEGLQLVVEPEPPPPRGSAP